MVKSLDSQLWHACAGGIVQMPDVDSRVFYFPQGHAEHALADVGFAALPRIPPLILCRVAAVNYLADPETDEVFAKISLVPVGNEGFGCDEGGISGKNGSESREKPTSFSKTLTQSDANNGGGFSVPRYCADTVFPRLDYNSEPPVQNVVARDVHGASWKFRHIYRGTPRRHLLTTGWSSFVNKKKLVAGDSVVFLRAENGDLRIGTRRAKKGGEIGGSWNGCAPVWSSVSAAVGPYGSFAGGIVNPAMHGGYGNGNPREIARVSPQSVIESAFLAANGQPFEVVYYPRASTPEFFVSATCVDVAMRMKWVSGMRLKMAFETEDSARVSWFLGTVNSAQVLDPATWPESPWRLLQVKWDEPELLQNVKSVSPWLVEVVPNPPVYRSPLSPVRKRLRPSHHHSEFPLDWPFQPQPLSRNHPIPLGPTSLHNIPEGIQGARHARLGPLSKIQDGTTRRDEESKNSRQKCETGKTPQFRLFGQPILTEQQMSLHQSHVTCPESSCLDQKDLPTSKAYSGHCKIFLDSNDLGRTIDLSVVQSYEELFKRLEQLFGVENGEVVRHVFYDDATGSVKQAGDELFSEFRKTAKRLLILTEPSCNYVQRKTTTGLPTVECGLDSPKQAEPLSIFG